MNKKFTTIFLSIGLIHGLLLGVVYQTNSEDVISTRSSKKYSREYFKVALRRPSPQANPITTPQKNVALIAQEVKASDEKESSQKDNSLLESFALDRNQLEAERSEFKAELRAEIEKNKFYPTVSKRLGQTGVVEVAFTLLDDGHIINVRLSRASLFERLNQSALEAVKKVHKFKPIPREWGEASMDLVVSLKFVTI